MTPATHQPSAGGQVHARVEIDLGERSYPILIGSSLLDDPATWSGLPKAASALIVTNETVGPLYAARLVRAAAAVSNRTDIRFETPDSSMVTP